MVEFRQVLPNSAIPLNQPIRIFHPRDGKSLLARLPLAPWRLALHLCTLYPAFPSSPLSTYSVTCSLIVFVLILGALAAEVAEATAVVVAAEAAAAAADAADVREVLGMQNTGDT